ncbi:MAG: prepilin-type N-terminal cleavage/methylation domain-containing protein [Synergistaceae bacterium]|jgi:general secretion pathway protein G|nr:prepilin-type N-terminal cleavage/methylation domain-containing protein [Synergistaceae bacterium]
MKKIICARKGGFTLVELLIVIVIIGILAGMMMLTMGSATDGANASRVVNDLRLLKSASLLYFADESKWPDNDSTSGFNADSLLVKYLDKPFASSYSGTVTVTTDSNAKFYYGLTPSPALSAKAKTKLITNGSVFGSGGGTLNTAASTFFMSVR